MITCGACSVDLAGKQYVDEEVSDPHCVSCYEKNFCSNCCKCQKIIGVNSKGVSFKESNYHFNCFTCTECGVKMATMSKVRQDEGGVFCLRCHSVRQKGSCDICSNKIQPGDRKLIVGTKSYHSKCLVCESCMEELGRSKFSVVDKKRICNQCYSRDYIKFCAACNKEINESGIGCRDVFYHAACFTCRECNKLIRDSDKFEFKEEKAYCLTCYNDLFTDKCRTCNKPVYEGQYVPYGKDMYHKRCFVCFLCSVNLSDVEFYPKDGHIVCTTCIYK